MSVNNTTLASNISAFGLKNQKKLTQTRVSIFGQNLTTDYIAMQLIGLGIGEILIQGRRTEPGLECFLELIDANPHTNITRNNNRHLMFKHTQFEPTVTIIGENSNSHTVEIQESVKNTKGDGKVFEMSNTQQQKYHTKLILASYVADLVRKTQFTLCAADKPAREYTFAANIPFSENQKITNPNSQHALLIGAGGIGTYLGMQLAHNVTPRISLFDHDIIEAKNLNRQLLYLDSVGKEKAKVLAERLKQLSPSSEIQGYSVKITSAQQIEQFLKEENVDTIYCATDNFESRLLISKVCEKHKIRLIEGGCNNTNAIVSQYEPNYTDPIHITRDFEKYLRIQTQAQSRPQSCIEKVNPSVVIPNAMAAGLMYATANKRFDTNNQPLFLNGTLEYNTFAKNLFEVNRQ